MAKVRRVVRERSVDEFFAALDRDDARRLNQGSSNTRCAGLGTALGKMSYATTQLSRVKFRGK
jgi:hypothetical protein